MEAKRICPYCMGELESRVSVCPHCGGVLAGRKPVGTLLAGRYTVGEMQSIDGEGILYRGVENTGRFRVTIKEYMPLTLSAERGTDALLRPKLGSEVLFKTTRMDFADLYRSIQRITPANGLEAVLDVFEENNTVYAVMENPGGIPLQQWLDERPSPVSAETARNMLQPVFDGVAAMHQVGLVHRGICPENIRVLENGRARLTGYATVGLRTACTSSCTRATRHRSSIPPPNSRAVTPTNTALPPWSTGWSAGRALFLRHNGWCRTPTPAPARWNGRCRSMFRMCSGWACSSGLPSASRQCPSCSGH